MSMCESVSVFENNNIKDLVVGMNETQMKIALKYFPVNFMYEELDRRATVIKGKLLKVKEEASDIKEDMSLESAQKKLQSLSLILSMTKETEK